MGLLFRFGDSPKEHHDWEEYEGQEWDKRNLLPSFKQPNLKPLEEPPY